MRQQLNENEATIKALLKSLANAAGTTAEKYITEQIQELDVTGEALKQRLGELEVLMEHQKLASQEFEFFQQMISSLAANIDDASVEEKRRLLKAIVRKIVWNGENAHVYLFAADGDVDLPPVNGEIEPLCPDSKCDSYEIKNETLVILDSGEYGIVYRIDALYANNDESNACTTNILVCYSSSVTE